MPTTKFVVVLFAFAVASLPASSLMPLLQTYPSMMAGSSPHFCINVCVFLRRLDPFFHITEMSSIRSIAKQTYQHLAELVGKQAITDTLACQTDSANHYGWKTCSFRIHIITQIAEKES